MAEEGTMATMATTDSADAKNEVETESKETETNAPKVEDLMAELAQLKADAARNKNALDKALREKGEITKRLRERQTAEEKEAEAKAEAEAERAEREAEKDKIIAQYEAKAMFAEMGLSGKELDAAIDAKLNGDDKTVYSVIAKFYEAKYESALKTKESEWLGNRPPVNVGVGESTTLTKEQFDNMSYKEKVELKNKDIETYKQLSQ